MMSGKEMDGSQPTSSKMSISNFSPELLHKVFSYVPQKELICNVTRVCKSWKDVARSLHTSLRIPMQLEHMFESDKSATSEEISELLKKTTRLKKLAIENFKWASDTDIDLLPHFFVSQLKEFEMWKDNFPESMLTFTMSFKNLTNCSDQLDDRFYFEKEVLSYFQGISDLICFQPEAISVDNTEVMAEFCRSKSNCQKGVSLTVSNGHPSVRLGQFLNFCKDNVQKIELWYCDVSSDIILTLKTLRSLKHLSLHATGNLEDFKSLFDESSQLKDLVFLKILEVNIVNMHLDVEVVRNVGNCCRNSLRHLSIFVSNVAEQHEWVACLKSFTALEALELDGLQMSPEHWTSVFGRNDDDDALKHLKMLKLSNCVDSLSPGTFASIAKFRGDTLKKLVVCGDTFVDPQDCAEHIRRLHALEELEIGSDCFDNCTHRIQFVDKLFGAESQLTRLTSFRLSGGIRLDESLVAGLKNCCGKTLKTLWFENRCEFCELRFDGHETPDECLSHLKYLSKLEVLSIRRVFPNFSSATWSSLFDGQSELNNLRDVSLWYNVNVDDNCVKNLAKLCGQSLKELNIIGCDKVTEIGINFVKEMCGSGLKLRHDVDSKPSVSFD